MNLAQLARGIRLFDGLSDEEVDDLLYRLNAVKRTFHKGEVIVHAGKEAKHLLAVASGHLHVYIYPGAANKHPVIAREITAGEVLGLWVLHVPEITCWSGTIVAAEDSVVVSLSMDSARRLFETAKPSTLRLSTNISKQLAEELFSTWRKLIVMSAPTLEERVMVYLRELDSESGNTGQVELPFNRNRMAEYFGVMRPSISRALCHLHDRGMLTWYRNVVRLARLP